MWCKYYVHMYTHGKMISAETIPGLGWGGMKENSEGKYWIYCRNFCKCHNVPPPSTTIYIYIYIYIYVYICVYICIYICVYI
jgi:hypothetical protein